MRVLVTASSRHGATAEIAERLGRRMRQVLQEEEHLHVQVDVEPVETVRSVEAYDAVVLGSAVYMGHWLAPARRFASAHERELASKPLWLFSSGSHQEMSFSGRDPADVNDISQATHALDHRVLPERVDRGAQRASGHAVVRAVNSADGDYPDLSEIDDWATRIARELAELGRHSAA